MALMNSMASIRPFLSVSRSWKRAVELWKGQNKTEEHGVLHQNVFICENDRAYDTERAFDEYPHHVNFNPAHRCAVSVRRCVHTARSCPTLNWESSRRSNFSTALN